jgi:molybdenum-dependent DNA-binding transcriptional regulator ModE
MNENLRNLVTVIQDEQNKILSQQNESTKTLINSYELAEKQIEQFSKNTLKSTEDTVRKQVGQLDQQLEQEINKTMSEMGSALTSITSRFTQDYKLLVEQMQQVINTNTRR